MKGGVATGKRWFWVHLVAFMRLSIFGHRLYELT